MFERAEIVSYGVKVPEIRKIAKEYFKRFSKEKWREAVKELMLTKVFENQIVSIFLLALFLNTERKINFLKLKS